MDWVEVPPQTFGEVVSTDLSGSSVINFPTAGTVCVLFTDLTNFSLVPQEVDEFKYLGLTSDHVLSMDGGGCQAGPFEIGSYSPQPPSASIPADTLRATPCHAAPLFRLTGTLGYVVICKFTRND